MDRKGDNDTLLLHIIHPAWRREEIKGEKVPVTCTVTPRDFFCRNATNGLLASLLISILRSFLYETSTTARTMSHSHGPDGAAGGLHTTNNASQLQPQGIAQPPPPVVLTPALLESLKVSKIFKDNTQAITSIHFDDTGSKCVTSAADESLHVYDCYTGKYVSLSLLLVQRTGSSVGFCRILIGLNISLFECRLEKTLFSKKYGVNLARFTHRSTSVVYASTKEDGKHKELIIHTTCN